MAQPPEDLPEPVRKAHAAMEVQRKATMRMVGGVMAMTMFMVVGAAAGIPDAGIITLVVSMLAWMMWNISLMTRNITEATRAQTILKEWDRKAISSELDAITAPRREEPELDDPRWQAVQTLLARIRELAGEDAHTIEVAQDVQAKLRGLIEDQATLQSAIEADRALGGDSDSARARSNRLESALDARAGTADRLVEAIRDLHVELAVRDASADPIVDRLEALLDQVEAEAEVASVQGDDERARLARAQKAQRTRE